MRLDSIFQNPTRGKFRGHRRPPPLPIGGNAKMSWMAVDRGVTKKQFINA